MCVLFPHRHAITRDCSGAATVEFALVAVTVIALAPLIWDLASVVSSYMSMSGGMRAGIQYALSNPSDSTGIANTIQNASKFASGSVTVTTSQSCQCSGSASICGQTCAGGSNPAIYDTITASYHVPTMLPYAGYPNNYFAISNSQTVRVQ